MATKPVKKAVAPKKVVKAVVSKRDLIDSVAKTTGISKTNTESVINEVLSSITGALKKEKRVQIIGFGTFKTVSRAARNGRNPSTGKEIKIPASKTTKFSPGKQLKEEVNKK